MGKSKSKAKGKPIKKKSPHRHADRFYDYLTNHRSEVMRYITVALVSGVLQFFLQRFLLYRIDPSEMLSFFIRFLMMFFALKYWVYGEFGSGAFYTGRQFMLASMSIVFTTYLSNYFTLLLIRLIGRPMVVSYVIQALIEILYFAIYQFFIFKEPKSN